MRINLYGKQMTVRDSLRVAIERKLKKFDKFFKDDANALIKTDKKRGFESVELTISCGGTLYRSEKRAETMMNALDETIEAILRQIRKNKTRLEKKLKEGAFVPVAEEEPVEVVEEHPEFKVRTKSFPVKPMTTEDAILQMLLLEHDFFLFSNPDTGALNLVYRRDDGDYGLIVPD